MMVYVTARNLSHASEMLEKEGPVAHHVGRAAASETDLQTQRSAPLSVLVRRLR